MQVRTELCHVTACRCKDGMVNRLAFVLGLPPFGCGLWVKNQFWKSRNLTFYRAYQKEAASPVLRLPLPPLLPQFPVPSRSDKREAV